MPTNERLTQRETELFATLQPCKLFKNIQNEKLTTIVKTFENHPSIMKSKYAIQEKFSIKPVAVKDVENIKNIPNNKASGGEIPLTILKQSRFNYEMLTDCINDAIVGE